MNNQLEKMVDKLKNDGLSKKQIENFFETAFNNFDNSGFNVSNSGQSYNISRTNIYDFMLLKHSCPQNIEIKNVIFSPPATIVFWSDNTKTCVKAINDELYDPEKGLFACISKKFFGNRGSYYNNIKKWINNYYSEESSIEEIINNMVKNIFDKATKNISERKN